MRTPLRLLAVALLSVLALAGPAGAATSSGVDRSIGGPRLDDEDVVVDEDAPALPEGLTASSWLVADLDSGEVLAARDAHGRYAPASTLKTLTALTLIPVVARDRLIVPTFEDVAVEGSKVGLVERASYPAHELFTAMMTVSGNDAANALATAAGGQQATAALMNDTARSLQALDTRAVNPHGLDAEGQVSSAYDLALIARAGLAVPDFAAYAATVRSAVGGAGSERIEVYTKNKLLKEYDGALGIKNGYTSTARASFVGAAQRDGRRLVVTLMKADPKVADEAIKLLDWGFSAVATAAPVGELVSPVPAAGALTPEAVVEPAPAAAPVRSSAPAEDGSQLPAALGGTVLAAAALLTVRRGPLPLRAPAGAGAAGGHRSARTERSDRRAAESADRHREATAAARRDAADRRAAADRHRESAADRRDAARRDRASARPARPAAPERPAARTLPPTLAARVGPAVPERAGRSGVA